MALLSGCEGQIADGPLPTPPDELPTEDAGPRDDAALPPVGACRAPTQRVFEGLAPTCASCHEAGSGFPAFASLRAFEQLIADDARWIGEGHERFLELLSGEGDGTIDQMPPGRLSFVQLEALGEASIRFEEIREWSMSHTPCPPEGAPPELPTARRLRADQLAAALRMGLGVEPSSVLARFRIVPPHAERSVGVRPATHAAWFALGGGDRLNGELERAPAGTTFMQTWLPLTQHWCGVSVDDETALFPAVSRDASSIDAAEAIRENIAAIHLRLLGAVPGSERVDALFNEVFVPLEARGDPATGWVGVCAAMLRDPLFLTY